MEKGFNKRGQELSIGTLVLIVLGVVVLVLLILGFSIGWKNLFSKVGITQSSDLSAMVARCKIAAATDSKLDFCEVKDIEIDGEIVPVNCASSQVISQLDPAEREITCP